MRTNTLRFKISVLYVAVIGLVLIFFQGILYVNYTSSVSNQFDVQLKSKAEQIGTAVNMFRGMLGRRKHAFNLAVQNALNLTIEYPNYFFMPESSEKFWMANAKKLGLDLDFIVIMDTQGHVIGKTKNVTRDLLLYFKRIGAISSKRNTFYKARVDANILRIVRVPYFYTYSQGYTIVLGTSDRQIQLMLYKHLLFMLISTLIFLVIASLIVRLFVVRVLTSVMEISNAARGISHDNLNARIKLTHTDEEIEHLTGSINEMIARLEKSFVHVKEFSLEVAHEVKTPMAIISGESQMALEKDCSSLEYKEILTVILKESRRTQDFVSDLLLLTKLDYRLVTMRFETIDLGEFLCEIRESMRVIAAIKGVEITTEIPPGSVLMKGDKMHLERVFSNLIDNGLKFTPQGGKVNMVVSSSAQRAVVLVSDNGCGIDPADLPKIFKKFYRGVEQDMEKIPGCGFGLSIVASIVELHQGHISIESQMGNGTSFKIDFPLVQ